MTEEPGYELILKRLWKSASLRELVVLPFFVLSATLFFYVWAAAFGFRSADDMLNRLPSSSRLR